MQSMFFEIELLKHFLSFFVPIVIVTTRLGVEYFFFIISILYTDKGNKIHLKNLKRSNVFHNFRVEIFMQNFNFRMCMALYRINIKYKRMNENFMYVKKIRNFFQK